PRRAFVEMLDVTYRLATIYRNRRRQARVEELALIVPDDDDGIGRDFVELVTEGVEGGPALHEALTALLHHDLVGEARRTRLQQPGVVVGLAAEPMVLVLLVRLGAEVPLLRRRGQQGSVRRSNPQNNICHSFNSQRPTANDQPLPTPNHQLPPTNPQPPTIPRVASV